MLEIIYTMYLFKLQSYGQWDHEKSWDYRGRITYKTSGPGFKARGNGSLENELAITELKAGKSVPAQLWPQATHPNTACPWVSPLFHNICAHNSQVKILKLQSGLKTPSIIIRAKVKDMVRHLASSDVPWTQGLFTNARALFITNYKYSLTIRRITQHSHFERVGKSILLPTPPPNLKKYMDNPGAVKWSLNIQVVFKLQIALCFKSSLLGSVVK